MDRRKQRMLAFGIGLVTALFLLEAGLRIAGTVFRNNPVFDRVSLSSHKHKPYIILCLGNSFTLGAGAPAGQGYPDQLQKLFDQEFPEKNAVVINAGVSNQNSSELLNRIEYDIMKWQPDLIILQTGQPNFWNQYQYARYLRKVNKKGAFRKKFIFYLNDLLYSCRVYRLSLLLIDELREKVRQPDPLAMENDARYTEAVEWFRRLETNYYMNNQVLTIDEEVERKIKFFNELLALRPADVNNYRYLGEICLFQKKYKEAAQWFIRGIKADSGYRKEEENRNYFFLRVVLKLSGDPQLKKLIDEFIAEFKKTHPQQSANFLSLSNQEIYQWVDSDIREMVEVIKNRKIKVLLQNFPPIDSMSPGHRAHYFNNFLLPEIARDLDLPFVDNNAIFKKILDQGEPREKIFVPDGHCTAKGYGLMARNIFNKIKEEGL
ncbi:MAG TPA: hypothetical protein PL125_04270 [Candidatus Omnitrophota bacterium]|nr:hypothetical protein [Candidatus Omnitrophota bacterium]HPT39394.1 hypothetical protein [Candidatus Omnitrophota bacterium]